ncbi:MAG: hypothetical protein ACKOHK_08475, partial [Planctomycetia bacterium]
MKTHVRLRLIPGLLLTLVSAATAVADFPKEFATFQTEFSPVISRRLGATPRHYRQIEPSLFHLCLDHADRLAALPADERLAVIVKLAEFIDGKRDATGDTIVIGPDRTIIGLLDPARGLEPKEITAIATAYGAKPTVFKQDPVAESIREVADRVLAAVGRAAAERAPTSIVVLGHGSPEEIQSYSIPFGLLADTLVDASAPAEKPLDLSHLVLVCDDCYSADVLLHVGTAIQAKGRDRGLAIGSLPI